jgi:hypothetical protein
MIRNGPIKMTSNMNKLLMALMAILLMTATQAQNLADCPLKGTPDCPLLNASLSDDALTALENCPWKGTPECPLLKAALSEEALAALDECPLKGTPDCPLMASLYAGSDQALNDCPLKGTPDCPIMAQRAAAANGMEGAPVNSEVPACCARRH